MLNARKSGRLLPPDWPAGFRKQLGLVAARDEQARISKEGLSKLDLSLVALGVDHKDTGGRDCEVVDVCAALGHPAVVEDDHVWAGLRQMDG